MNLSKELIKLHENETVNEAKSKDPLLNKIVESIKSAVEKTYDLESSVNSYWEGSFRVDLSSGSSRLVSVEINYFDSISGIVYVYELDNGSINKKAPVVELTDIKALRKHLLQVK